MIFKKLIFRKLEEDFFFFLDWNDVAFHYKHIFFKKFKLMNQRNLIEKNKQI